MSESSQAAMIANRPDAERPTVGILYPGELGSTIGRLLAHSGWTVVTTVQGRSERTRRLAEDAGFVVLHNIAEVAKHADLLVSTVSPAAALPVAQLYLDSRGPQTRPQLFVDLNSTSPETARRLDDLLRCHGLAFVDGALHGLASRLPERGTLYLSGASATQLGEWLGGVLPVKVLGSEAGQASTFKMLISGLAKGTVALFVEMGLAARHAGLLDDLLACYRQAYPGIVELVERLLPTYPQHAVRRAEEAREVEQTMHALGLRPCLTAAVREWTEELARANLGAGAGTEAKTSGSLRELIETLAVHGILEMSAEAEPHTHLLTSLGSAAATARSRRSPLPLA